jgi:hypothetical protein
MSKQGLAPSGHPAAFEPGAAGSAPFEGAGHQHELAEFDPLFTFLDNQNGVETQFGGQVSCSSSQRAATGGTGLLNN